LATDPRHLHWDARLNVRDLGGFSTRGGRMTRDHTVIRADNLCRLTHHGRLALVRYGVRTVIDLRDPKEYGLEHDPFSREELADVGRTRIPLLTEDFWRVWRQDTTPHEGDLLILETCRDSLAALFVAIAEAPAGGVVLMCHAGKERTGLTAALVLTVAGVGPETLAREHALSDRYLEPAYAAWVDAQPDLAAREKLAEALRTDPEQMKLTLGALDELYGGIARYLLDSGVSRAELERVRERVVA
jgi:protein tyrosine/serine phosphatase